MSTPTQIEIAARNHRRAVRFFWGLLIGATTSGRVYFWAVTATAAIGAGAFAVSFLALRDLMLGIGYTSATALAFPAIIDTAVAVATVMLVALADKPARRTRTATMPASAQTPAVNRVAQSANPQVMPVRSAQDAGTGGASRPGKGLASVQLDPAQPVRSAQAEAAHDEADLASDLIASGVTTQSVDTVLAVLSAHHGASINAAAKALGINYRTAQRILAAAADRRQNLMAAS